jgi:hypothetical protein
MTTSLSGNWRYRLEDDPDFAQPGWDDSAWEEMAIPRNWFLAGLDHHGVVWFRREFRHRPRQPYARLHFDGVDYFADVYLNGTHLGRHSGYFEPFAFEAHEALRAGKNVLAVRVESPYEVPGLDGWYLHKRLIKGVLNHHDCRPGGGWEETGQAYNTGGIWNRVYLEECGSLTIEGMTLRADLDRDPAILRVELAVHNRTRDRRARLEVQCAAENFKAKPQLGKFPLEIPAGESLQVVELPVKQVKRWQPWDRGFPHLYRVSAALTSAKEVVETESLFGFRTLRVDEGYHWFVNEQPYFLRGSNYLPSQWLSETLFPEAATAREHPFGVGAGADFFARDVSLARQAHLNLLRVHAHVLPPEFHAACDRAGVLVWQDFALQWGYSDEAEIQAEAVRQIQAMVKLLNNHPSIAAWCCHNESPCDAPWMAGEAGSTYDPAHNRKLDERLERAVRKLDPTRYVHRNSGTGDGHAYPGWYFSHWRTFQNLPGAPFVTEYGAQALPARLSLLKMLPEFQTEAGFSELKRLKEWLEANKRIKPSTQFFIKWGTALWSFTEKTPALQWLYKLIRQAAMKRGMGLERSIYKHLPPEAELPEELRPARQVWEAWRFHDFQPAETFDNGIQIGASLDEFIASSQRYQAHLLQYSTECYRRAKDCPQNDQNEKVVTGLIQFDFTDPWPSVAWSVLDYWRVPKPGYDALQRAMQPVLPSFQLPEKIEAGKAALTVFQAVNDTLEAFPRATCEWVLSNENGDIASAPFPVDLPANGVSKPVRLTLPSLNPGAYRFSVTLTAGRQMLGQNWYDILVDSQPKEGKEKNS